MSEKITELAIIEMHKAEEALQAIASSADMAVAKFTALHALNPHPDTWAVGFAHTWTILNEDYREKVLQDLQRDAKYLRALLVPDHESSTPLQELLRYIIAIAQGVKDVRERHDELSHLYRPDSTDGALRGFARAAIVRSLDGMQGTISEVQSSQLSLQEKMNDWKAYFMVLSQEEHLSGAVYPLQTPTVTRDILLAKITPLFDVLISIITNRRRIIRDIRQFRSMETIKWQAQRSSGISLPVFTSTLATLAGYGNELKANDAAQESVLLSLQTVAEEATTVPQFLPGPHGCELSVGRIHEARSEFEALRLLSARTGHLLYDVYEELKDAKAISDAGFPLTLIMGPA